MIISNSANTDQLDLLSDLWKIYNRVIFNRIYIFCDRYELFDKQLFGFRSKFSTIDAKTLLVKDILNSFNNKDCTIAVFCDLSKALNIISHDILLYKLNQWGIRVNALKLIASYLQGHKSQ